MSKLYARARAAIASGEAIIATPFDRQAGQALATAGVDVRPVLFVDDKGVFGFNNDVSFPDTVGVVDAVEISIRGELAGFLDLVLKARCDPPGFTLLKQSQIVPD